MIPVAALLGFALVLATLAFVAASHRGHDEYGPSVKAYAAFRAALARSDSPARRR